MTIFSRFRIQLGLSHFASFWYRTVSRKSSIGELCVCVGGLDIPKFEKNSTYLKCFIFQFAGLGGLFGGTEPTKDPRGDGTVLVMEAFSLYCFVKI